MSLKFRRFLYIFFILIFLIITPLLCLYAAGYKLGNGLAIKKTGILIIDSKPSGAKIYIDNKARRLFFDKLLGKTQNIVKTPAKIKNLLPGEYDIKLEKPNYWPWEKRLEIRSGESTFAEDIILFKKDLPILLQTGRFDSLSFSPSLKYCGALEGQNIFLFNLEKNTSKKYSLASSSAFGFAASNTKIIWSPDERAIIINNLLFWLDDWQNPIALDKLIGQNYFLTKWGEDINIIYFKLNGALLSLNIANKKIKTIIPETKTSGFSIKNNFIYLIEKNLNKSVVGVWDMDKEDYIRKISLPFSDYSFIHLGSGLVNLYDDKFQILYLIDPLSPVKPLHDAIANITNSSWADENKLLYSDGSEIWLYDLANNNKTLLTRLGQKITNLFMHPSKNYVVFATDNSINTIELDDREKRNITKIIDINELKWPRFDTRNSSLYFYAEIGSQAGLYKLSI